MRRVRQAPLFVVVMFVFLVAGAVATLPGPASADPLPADYSGTTHGDILSVDFDAFGDTVGTIGHAETAVDSTVATPAHAETSNVDASATGIAVDVVSQETNADNDTPTGSFAANLGSVEVDVPPMLDTGVITGFGNAEWAGDTGCVPDGAPIARAWSQLARATLTLPGVELLDLGTAATAGDTVLQAGTVVSRRLTSLASLTLINDLVTVDVVTEPELTATSDGTTGSVTANDYAVDVTHLGNTVRLTAGMSTPTLDVLVPGVALVHMRIEVGEVTDTSTGAAADGSTTFLTALIQVNTPDDSTNFAFATARILPLQVGAVAPAGRVECDALDPPAITVPNNGATTGASPTISGTGVAGATVTVTEGGTTIGTATVTAAGTWTLVPSTPFSRGSHTIAATQVRAPLASAESAPVTFTVADDQAAPVITSPADGSATNDRTPTISGTGEPGTTVEVRIDGELVGTAVVATDGSWSLTVEAELACGKHRVVAVGRATGASSGPTDFTIHCSRAPPEGHEEPTGPGVLPSVGSPAGLVGQGVLGLGLLATGTALLVAYRRRGHAPS